MAQAQAIQTTRETKRATEDSDRTLIAITIDQKNSTSPTVIEIDVATLDGETNEEVSGHNIHVERDGLVPALNALGGYLQIVATKMAYAIVDRASKDPKLAKELGLEEGAIIPNGQ
jgi:hypothetical protein